MTTKASKHFGSATVAVALLVIGVSTPGSAQPARNPDQTTAQKATKPASAPKRPATPAAGGSQTSADYWSVKTLSSDAGAATRQYATPNRAVPQETTVLTSEFGRVPVQPGGTFGLSASRAMRPGEFYDGRPVPGLDPNTQRESAYVGLSLSVSSTSKTLPVPLPWNKIE